MYTTECYAYAYVDIQNLERKHYISTILMYYNILYILWNTLWVGGRVYIIILKKVYYFNLTELGLNLIEVLVTELPHLMHKAMYHVNSGICNNVMNIS